MNEIFLLPQDELNGGLYRRIYLHVRKNRWSWQSIGATFGLARESLSILLGLPPWAAARFLAPSSFGSPLHVFGAVLLVLPIPLLAVGAYCLGLLEKKPPAIALPVESWPSVPVRSSRLRAQRPHTN